MHEYAVEGSERRVWFYIIAACAISATPGLNWLLIQKCHVPAGPWLDLVSPFGLFGTFLWLFDSFIWKALTNWSFFARLGWFVPDFSGNWAGVVVAFYNGQRTTSSIRLTIQQTWTRIQIKGRTRNADSDSRMATISKDTKELRYEFALQPDHPTAAEPPHRGVAGVRQRRKHVLSGGFYTQLETTKNGKIALLMLDKSNLIA